MKRIVILLLFIPFFAALNAQNKELINEHFGRTKKFGMGVTRDVPTVLYSRFDEQSKFATLYLSPSGNEDKIMLTPDDFASLCSPFYFSSHKGQYSYTDVTFRVINTTGNWMEIVFNEKEGLTCYVKRDERTRFQTWDEYFMGKNWCYIKDGEYLGGQSLPKIMIGLNGQSIHDKVKGSVIHKNLSLNCHATQVIGEWIYVESTTYDVDKIEGWVRWRKDNDVLVTILETWGLE